MQVYPRLRMTKAAPPPFFLLNSQLTSLPLPPMQMGRHFICPCFFAKQGIRFKTETLFRISAAALEVIRQIPHCHI